MDFEGTIRNLSEQGKVAACVPAALKDAGILVPDKYFIQAALVGVMDPIKVAQELGYTSKEIEGMDLDKLHAQINELRKQGLYPLIQIGAPTNIGVLPQHINAVLEQTTVDNQPGLKLGGIPPFGREKGNTFSLVILKKIVPKNGIIILEKVSKAT